MLFANLLLLCAVSVSAVPTRPYSHRSNIVPLDDADLLDLGSMTDPSIEARATPSRPNRFAAHQEIQRRQATRAQIDAREDLLLRRQTLTTAPNPQISSTSGSCPAFYKLQARGLPFYPGRAYTPVETNGQSGVIGAVRLVKDVEDCYALCRVTSGCDGFSWYSNGSPATGQGYCYLLSVGGTESRWLVQDKTLAPDNESGTYFINGGTCQSNNWNPPATVASTCCSTRPWTSFNTCTATTLTTSGTSYYQNWHSFNNQGPARVLPNVSQCQSYCQSTNNCFGFVWAPTTSTCYLKITVGTSGVSSYVQNNWASQDQYSSGASGGLYLLNRSCSSLEGSGIPGGALNSCCNV